MSEPEPKVESTPRDAAIEKLLTDTCVWGMLSGVLFIVMGMTTNVQSNVNWAPVRLWVLGIDIVLCIVLSATLLRHRANHGTSGALIMSMVIPLCTVAQVIALYTGLYVGAWCMVQDLMHLQIIDAIESGLVGYASYIVIRDAMRLMLMAQHFTPESSMLRAMEAAMTDTPGDAQTHQ